jgi:hypothetical protein
VVGFRLQRCGVLIYRSGPHSMDVLLPFDRFCFFFLFFFFHFSRLFDDAGNIIHWEDRRALFVFLFLNAEFTGPLFDDWGNFHSFAAAVPSSLYGHRSAVGALTVGSNPHDGIKERRVLQQPCIME